jgi:DNA polymerase I
MSEKIPLSWPLPSPPKPAVFLVLDWPFPVNIIDLYAEHLRDVNGLKLSPKLNGLVPVMARHRLPVMTAIHKVAMRSKIMDQDQWNAAEMAEILDYCAEDVDASERLLQAMVAKDLIDWPRALWRGAYMAATAHTSHHGIPVDAELYRRFTGNWADMQHTLIERVDASYGVFAGDSFNRKLFAGWLARNGIPWPRLPSGQLQLEQQVFKSQAEAYPVLGPLRELTVTLAQMRSTGLAIGADGRNRYYLAPLMSATGRNQPSTSKNILGSASWLRGLITPPAGYGLAMIDWTAQEIGIAAGRSGDPGMCEAYRSGDVHMAMAIGAKLAPVGATKSTHPAARERAKTVSLGANYGISPRGVSLALGISAAEGRELLQAHATAYPVFWRWVRNTVDSAVLTSCMTAPLGWRWRLVGELNPRAVQNWTMQAIGAEMLRAAVVLMVRSGLTLCATAHDAIMILAPLDRLETDIALARNIMERASLSFTGGLLVRTDVRTLLPGERYLEPRGARMWEIVTGLLSTPLAQAA